MLYVVVSIPWRYWLQIGDEERLSVADLSPRLRSHSACSEPPKRRLLTQADGCIDKGIMIRSNGDNPPDIVQVATHQIANDQSALSG